MRQSEALEYLLHVTQFHQTVISNVPVRQHGRQRRECRQTYLRRIFSRVCGNECRNQHIATCLLHTTIFRIIWLSGIWSSGNKSAVRIRHTTILIFQTLCHLRNIINEFVERCVGITVGCRRTAQSRSNGTACHRKATRTGGRNIFIHELHLVCTVVRAIGCQTDFQSPYRFQLYFKIKFFRTWENSRRCLVHIVQQPTSRHGFLQIRLIRKTESKIQSRRHYTAIFRLTEHVAHLWHELRDIGSRRTTPAHIGISHRHGQACGVVADFFPDVLVFRQILNNNQFYAFFSGCQNLQVVFIDNFCFQRERFSLQCRSCNLHLLVTQIVLHIQYCIFQLISTLEFLRLFHLRRCTCIGREPAVHLFQIFVFIIQSLKINTAVNIPHSIVCNRITDSCAPRSHL